MSSPILAARLAGNVLGSISNAFVIAESRDPGGPPGPPRLIAPPHLHHSDDEAWYVREGTLRVQVGDDGVEAHAGSGSSFREVRRTHIGVQGLQRCVICS